MRGLDEAERTMFRIEENGVALAGFVGAVAFEGNGTHQFSGVQISSRLGS